MARAAQPSASCNPYCSKLIRKSPGNGEKKRPKPPEPRVLQSRPVRRQPPRPGKGPAAGAGAGGASEPGQASRNQPESGQGVGGQAVLAPGQRRLAAHQRRQVAPAGGGDAVAVLADETGRHLL